jgi:hypothetical protein
MTAIAGSMVKLHDRLVNAASAAKSEFWRSRFQSHCFFLPRRANHF